jgi:hypothetical protein
MNVVVSLQMPVTLRDEPYAAIADANGTNGHSKMYHTVPEQKGSSSA